VKKYFLFLFGAVFVVWGCATSSDVQRVQSRLDHKLSGLQTEVAKLQNELSTGLEESKALRKVQADSGADLSEMREEIKKLRGAVEELRHNLESLRADRGGKDAKLDDLALRIAFIENFIGVGKKPEGGSAEKKDEKQASKDEAGIKPDRESFYSSAYEEFKEGKYEEARNNFKRYIEQYPRTDLTDNAQFWIGESYYLENQFEKAILEYEKVIKNHPDGDKVPAAILKQGMAFQNLGDKTSAKLLFDKVIKEYPNTSQAKIAKAKLAEVK
jgi:tol-pal system protein YbgF